MSHKFKIVDAHVHFHDYKVNTHTFLDSRDPGYEAFVGEYSQLEKQYLPSNYLLDSKNYEIEGVIWHEFLSDDPIKEAQWAQNLVTKTAFLLSLVTQVNFLDPNIEQNLEVYSSLPNVHSVREHMVYDENNPLKRFAQRSDLFHDSIWKKNLRLLSKYSFKCCLEVFSPQLPDLIQTISENPNIEFTIALMGWPLDLSSNGKKVWESNMRILSKFDNVCVSISAIECIFGMNWKEEEARPWILSTIDLFGVERCMFGSHMPIGKLSRSCDSLYHSYEKIIADFSKADKKLLFCAVAKRWFKL